VKKYRLSKRLIIKSPALFSKIFTHGKRYHSKHILLIALNAEEKKVGFTVSKKISGAVNRNRAKRRLRELFRLYNNFLPERRMFVFMAREGFNQSTFERLKVEYRDLIIRLKK